MRIIHSSTVIIDEHAFKHGLTEADIRHAWLNSVALRYRRKPGDREIVAIGPRKNGNLIQLIARELASTIVVYHALEPPTKNVLKELGLLRR